MGSIVADKDLPLLARRLQPFLLNFAKAAGGSGGSSNNSPGSGVVAQHDLGGDAHTGQLRQGQATWAYTKAEAIAHAANPDAHHARVHGVASNNDHTITAPIYSLVGTTATNTLGVLATSDNGESNHNTVVRSSASGGIRMAYITTLLLSSAGSDNTTIRPGGDLILDPTGNDVRPEVNYDINLGSISKKYLTLHAAELWVETLVAQDTIATIGGRVLVGPTTTLIADLSTGATTIDVKHNQMASGDRVYMEANGKLEWLAITSSASTITGGYRYTVTRNLDGTGANQWYAGDALFNTGQAGNGFIDLYSLYGVPRAGQSSTQRAGPTIVGNVRLSSTYNDIRERWAIGNLDGLYDYGTEAYGAAFGDPTKAWIGVDATNGVRIMSGGSTEVIRLDTAGNSYFAGVMSIGTSGEIRQGVNWLAGTFTGLRIWNQSSIGRIAGYNGGVIQWYGNTDGKLYAAAGDVWLDNAGVNILVVPVDTDPAVFRFVTSGGDVKGTISCAYSAGPLPDPNDGMYYYGYQHRFQGAMRAQSGLYTDALTAHTEAGNIAVNSPLGTAFAGLSYNTGWGHYGGSNQTGRYKKIGDIVTVEGLVARTSGSLAIIATLPSGYRPAANHFFPVATNSGPGVVYVDSAGNIGHTSGGTTWVSLSSISFSVV